MDVQTVANNATAGSTEPSSGFYKSLLADDIRLLRILPGPWEERVSCELEHFTSDTVPSYYALSYAWGDQKDACAISVNGEQHEAGPGLFTALRRIRKVLQTKAADSTDAFASKTHENLWLWADALCLNQRDDGEKQIQVPRMGQIYGNAERVVAWLGENSDKENAEIAFIKNLCEIEVPGLLSGVVCLEHHETLRKAISDRSHSVLSSCLAFVTRPFFGRQWIIQEMALANDEPVMLVGQHQLEFLSFFRLWVFVSGIAEATEPIADIPIAWEHCNVADMYSVRFQRLYNKKQYEGDDFRSTAKRLVRYFKAIQCEFKCSREHDMIYSLLGIVGADVLPEPLRPDYSRPFADVYRDYAKFCIEQTGDLGFLDRSGRAIEGVPTWVPDLRFGVRGAKAPQFTPQISFVAGGRMRVSGVVVERCQKVWSPEQRCEGDDNDVWLQRQIKTLHAFLRNAAEETQRPLDEVVRIWQENSTANEMRVAQFGPLERSLTAGEKVSRDDWGLNDGNVEEALLRSVYIGDRGILGHPAWLDMRPRPGDLVCEIIGFHRQVLLRPCPGNTNEVEFLGGSLSLGYNQSERFRWDEAEWLQDPALQTFLIR